LITIDFVCGLSKNWFLTGYGPSLGLNSQIRSFCYDMAESRTVTVVPLSSTNYATWKVQCKMALIKEGLWSIVNRTETEPEGNADRRAKFVARRDGALAIIMLAMEPSLLYLVGQDPTNPVDAWKTLADQFQCKTWANKLELKRKLFSLRLACDWQKVGQCKSTSS